MVLISETVENSQGSGVDLGIRARVAQGKASRVFRVG